MTIGPACQYNVRGILKDTVVAVGPAVNQQHGITRLHLRIANTNVFGNAPRDSEDRCVESKNFLDGRLDEQRILNQASSHVRVNAKIIDRVDDGLLGSLHGAPRRRPKEAKRLGFTEGLTVPLVAQDGRNYVLAARISAPFRQFVAQKTQERFHRDRLTAPVIPRGRLNNLSELVVELVSVFIVEPEDRRHDAGWNLCGKIRNGVTSSLVDYRIKCLGNDSPNLRFMLTHSRCCQKWGQGRSIVRM